MNILITSIIDLEKTTYSRLHYFIDHLLKKGHNITVVSIKDNWKNKDQKGNKEITDKIKLLYITKEQHGAIRQKMSLPFNINRIIPEDIIAEMDIHLCYNSLFLGYFIRKKLRKYHIKTVYDLADDLPEMISTSPHLPPVIRRFGGLVGSFMLKKNLQMSQAITITAKEFRESMGVSKFNHFVVPNGVDIKKFRPKKKRNQNFVVGYLGALREWVDLRPMLLAVKELNQTKKVKNKPIRVLVVGGEEDLEKYKEFVRKNNMDFVEFTGNVSYEKVPDYINKMDVATIPFKKNPVTDGTCPLKLLEYMAMKKPCICSDLNEIKRMVKDKVLYASTKKDWKIKILKLYENPELIKKMGTEGRSFTEKHYDWKNIGEKMERILLNYSKRY